MPESKKVVIKVDILDGDDKRKALKAVASLSGIDSLAMDMKHKKLTIIGDIDPVDVVGKLKEWNPSVVTVGPANEESKTEGGSDKKNVDGDENNNKKKKNDEEEAFITT